MCTVKSLLKLKIEHLICIMRGNVVIRLSEHGAKEGWSCHNKLASAEIISRGP